MKFMCIFALLALVGVSPAEAAISTSEAGRLREAAMVLESLRATPDKSIPADLWSRAQCAAIIPSLKKAAFIVGGEYGKGVMTCKTAEGWSAPAFVQLQKGTFGFQLGAEEVDLVLLIMNRSGLDKLLRDKVALGAGASIAAGPVGRTAQASTDLRMTAEILSYSRSHGVFAGVDLSGGVLGPDGDSNVDAYGPSVTPQQILLERRVKAPVEAESFLAAVNNEFRPTATTGVKPY